MAKINLSQLAEQSGDGTFPILDPGTYELELKEAEFKTSSNGNPMIAVRFQEVDQKVGIFENWTLIPSAFFRMKMFLNHTGISLPEGDLDPESDEFEDFLYSLKGTQVTAKVKVTERVWDGEKRKNNEIDKYVTGKAGGAKKKRRTL